VISTPNVDELYGLRAIDDSAYAVGRTKKWNGKDATFDALVARIDRHGQVTIQVLDIDQGDIAFDVAPAREGGIVVVGATSYWQNPSGASVSERSNAFASWIDREGRRTMLTLPNGPRHNEARFAVRLGEGRYWIGGMRDGPGTHSADGDLSLLRARAFLKRSVLP
jgi:hypothetical protein